MADLIHIPQQPVSSVLPAAGKAMFVQGRRLRRFVISS
jgi:hypothetical protein